MKRERIDLIDIAAWPNLQLAYWKASRGKRLRPDVIKFSCALEQNLARLAGNILSGQAPVGSYRSFEIHDPKRRIIHAVGFADRVLHHAIMNLAEPMFEKTLVDSTFACRPGKGVHRAVQQVQKNLQRYPWYVQVDVSAYFASIDHQRLLSLLMRRFKGADFFDLLRRIINSYQTLPGKGLPIGSLTSQHFANYYLDGADRFLLNHPLVRAHVRFMDDIVWWCDDKAAAYQVLQAFSDYMERICLLSLKANPQIHNSRHGLTFCGFRIFPANIRLTLRKKRRYRFLRSYYEHLWQSGQIDTPGLQRAYDSVLAATKLAKCLVWRQRNLQIHPSLYDN